MFGTAPPVFSRLLWRVTGEGLEAITLSAGNNVSMPFSHDVKEPRGAPSSTGRRHERGIFSQLRCAVRRLPRRRAAQLNVKERFHPVSGLTAGGTRMSSGGAAPAASAMRPLLLLLVALLHCAAARQLGDRGWRGTGETAGDKSGETAGETSAAQAAAMAAAAHRRQLQAPSPTGSPTGSGTNIPANVQQLVDSLLGSASPGDVPRNYRGRVAFATEADAALLPRALRTPVPVPAPANASDSDSGVLLPRALQAPAPANSSDSGLLLPRALQAPAPANASDIDSSVVVTAASIWHSSAVEDWVRDFLADDLAYTGASSGSGSGSSSRRRHLAATKGKQKQQRYQWQEPGPPLKRVRCWFRVPDCLPSAQCVCPPAGAVWGCSSTCQMAGPPICLPVPRFFRNPKPQVPLLLNVSLPPFPALSSAAAHRGHHSRL